MVGKAVQVGYKTIIPSLKSILKCKEALGISSLRQETKRVRFRCCDIFIS